MAEHDVEKLLRTARNQVRAWSGPKDRGQLVGYAKALRAQGVTAEPVNLVASLGSGHSEMAVRKAVAGFIHWLERIDTKSSEAEAVAAVIPGQVRDASAVPPKARPPAGLVVEEFAPKMIEDIVSDVDRSTRWATLVLSAVPQQGGYYQRAEFAIGELPMTARWANGGSLASV